MEEKNGTGWKAYPPTPQYELSREGFVRISPEYVRKGVPSGQMLKPQWRNLKYIVYVNDGGVRRQEDLAQMVAWAHLGAPPDNDSRVIFLNGDSRDCHVENLTWSRVANYIPKTLLADDELFRPVEGFRDYVVTSKGRVWSARKQVFLTPNVSIVFGPSVVFQRNRRSDRRALAKLVALHFPEIVGKPPIHRATVEHIDGNYNNCAVENLRWTTQQAISAKRLERGKKRREEADMASTHRAPCPDVIRFLLNHYKGVLPAHEEIKDQRYYYIDGRFRPLCSRCASRIVQQQSSDLNSVDEGFPVDCRILWSGQSVTCLECGDVLAN